MDGTTLEESEKEAMKDEELELDEELDEEEVESEEEKKNAKTSKGKKETLELDFSMNAIDRLRKEIDFTDEVYKKAVGEFLIKEFVKDENLRMAYFTRKVTLEQVWKHIYEYARAQTKKQGSTSCVALPDAEVYGQAIHFVLDGEVKETKDTKVVLTKEVKKSLQEQAEEEYLAEQKRKLEEAARKKAEREAAAKKKALEKEKQKQEESGQISLFDWGDEDDSN